MFQDLKSVRPICPGDKIAFLKLLTAESNSTNAYKLPWIVWGKLRSYRNWPLNLRLHVLIELMGSIADGQCIANCIAPKEGPPRGMYQLVFLKCCWVYIFEFMLRGHRAFVPVPTWNQKSNLEYYASWKKCHYEAFKFILVAKIRFLEKNVEVR